MDKCIILYKRISLFSLFLFMFGILLINICIIGFSVGSNNIALAMNSDGTYESNYFSIPDGTAWTFNASSSGSEYVFYEDSNWSYSIIGNCTLVNNVFTSLSSTSYIRFTSKGNFSFTSSCLATNYFSDSVPVFFNASNSSTFNLSPNGNNYYYKSSVGNGMNTLGSYLQIPTTSSITLVYICFMPKNTFTGYVPNSYYSNGYNQGYTDGVNSAGSGGDYTDGYNDGYDVGYDSGYSQGYDDGYRRGALDFTFDDMPINFYAPSYYSQQTSFLSSSFSLTYDHILYEADFDQYYEINDVYRTEYVSVNSSNPIIHFNTPLHSTRFSISFGVDISSNYSSLTGILLSGSQYNYYYDVGSNNSLFNSHMESSNRAIYYTLNITVDYIDDYFINLLFDNSGSVGACIVLPIVVSSMDYTYTANQTELGYSAGYDDGSREGYSSGYNAGYDIGHANGFTEGLTDANDYNWYSLFGAIYDVPLQTFNGLFDLTILGVNLKGFILGLISLCIVLFILKIVFK